MAAKKRVIVAAFAALLILFGAALQAAVSSFTGPLSDLPIYVGAPGPYSYILDTNTTHYFAFNGTTGYNTVTDTNCSAVLQEIIAANMVLFFRVGTYPINYLLPINAGGIHFIGAGWGTIFDIGPNGGFNISHTNVLRDIRFRNIWWAGSDAVCAITSAMPDNTRIDDLIIEACWFDQFDNTGAIAILVENGENVRLIGNIFYQSNVACVQFQSNNYDSGNHHISDNTFYLGYDVAGEAAVKLYTKAYDGTNGALGVIHASGNHYLYVTYNGYAWNATTWEGDIKNLNIIHDRLENGGLIITNPRNSTFDISGVEITDCILKNTQIASPFDTTKICNFGAYTRKCLITDNVEVQNQAASGYWIMDNSTTSTQANRYMNNYFSGSASCTFQPNPYSLVRGNYGLEAYYTMKVEGADLLRNSGNSYVSNFPNATGGWYNSLGSATKYTVSTNDVLLTVSGGTVTSIIIYDPNGNSLGSIGTSCALYRVPFNFAFNITYSVEPTRQLTWIP